MFGKDYKVNVGTLHNIIYFPFYRGGFKDLRYVCVGEQKLPLSLVIFTM